ncbi:hypothetical protein B0J14DRAFT_15526 [Halenospora varia]|nr:hypothetical protein B0J14DRAFT_15526 [Halenospora varia]
MDPFPLLGLPREVRDMVYKFVRKSPTGIIKFSQENQSLQIHQLATTLMARPSGSPINPSMCYTCRQISSEARKFLWNQSDIVFEFDNFPRLVNIPLGISCHMRHVAIDVKTLGQIGTDLRFFHRLQTMAQNLETLTLILPYRITTTIRGVAWRILQAIKMESTSSYYLAHLDVLRHLQETFGHVTKKLLFTPSVIHINLEVCSVNAKRLD